MNKKVMSVIQVALVAVIIASGVKVYKYNQSLNQTDNIENNSRDMLSEVEEFDDSEELRLKRIQASRDFLAKLAEEYPDTVAHIDIKDTKVSYPVVQTTDNSFYLTHAPTKEWNPNGSIFMSYLNNPDFEDDNTIIYGHHIKSGKLFHNLHKFREQEFYDKVNTIEMHTSQGPKTYKIFSVYIADPSYQYKHANYESVEDKYDFFREVIDKNIITTNYDEDELFSEDSKIVTLSTCVAGGATRFVVHGIEISE